MALTQQQIQQVETVLRNSLRHKFQNYNPEPAVMPFYNYPQNLDNKYRLKNH